MSRMAAAAMDKIDAFQGPQENIFLFAPNIIGTQGTIELA
jgi:hypothetical protein